jgi:hypothetical protein
MCPPGKRVNTTRGPRGKPGFPREASGGAMRRCEACGASRTRTGDLLGAISALFWPKFGLTSGFPSLPVSSPKHPPRHSAARSPVGQRPSLGPSGRPERRPVTLEVAAVRVDFGYVALASLSLMNGKRRSGERTQGSRPLWETRRRGGSPSTSVPSAARRRRASAAA